ncbi:amino acid permease [Candidatus Woesearchaeota archaeon]|nr:amino acid permease [Candidatus Woesearchaeota archaeon]
MEELKKTLGFPALLLITINSIMGTGIFFLPALGAKTSGTASLVAWVILSLVSIYIATIFGELCSMFPKSGGIYEYAKQVYGRTMAFIVGWTALVASNVTIAMLIIGAIQYLLPFHIPYIKEIVSIGFILIFNYISYKGIKTSATMLITFAFITLGTILALIIPNFLHFDTHNLTSFNLEIPLLFLTIFMIAETFFGWESSLYLTEETRNGRKVVPMALLLGTIFICIFSLIFVFSSLGAIPAAEFGASTAPLLDLAVLGYGEIGVKIFMILVYLAIIGSVAGWIITSPRLILTLAKDNLLPKGLAKIHPEYQTPVNAIIFQTIVSTIIVILGAGSYETLLEMLLPMLLLLYGSVMLSYIILKVKRPNLERLFKAPFGLLGASFIIIFFFALLTIWFVNAHDAAHILELASIFIFIGVPIYYMIDLYYNPRTVAKTNNLFAYFTLLTEEIMLPKRIRRKIIQSIGLKKEHTVLEYGSSVGTLTLDLAEEVGPKGKIYATDISHRCLNITKKRMKKRNHDHVTTLHDHMLAERVHPDIPKVDLIVSVGAISYLKDVDNVLKEMNQRLSEGDRVCFVEYDNFFFIMGNNNWIANNHMITHVFRRNGFQVEIETERGLLWDYLFIFGKKIHHHQPATDLTETPVLVKDFESLIKDIASIHHRKAIKQDKAIIIDIDHRLRQVMLKEKAFRKLMVKVLEIINRDTRSYSRIEIVEGATIKCFLSMEHSIIQDYIKPAKKEDFEEKRAQEERIDLLAEISDIAEHELDGDMEAVSTTHITRESLSEEEIVVGIYDPDKSIEGEFLELRFSIPIKN